MSYHIHNLKIGDSMWGPRNMDPYSNDAELIDDWKWWRIDAIEPQGGYEYRVQATAEDGEKMDLILNTDLSIAAKDADGEYL